eukprot:g10569.t1
MEIKTLQESSNLILPRTTFNRIVRDITDNSDICYNQDAVEALQTSLEDPLSLELTIRPHAGVLRIREEHASLSGVPEMTCDWSGMIYEWWTVLQRGPSFSKLVWDIPAKVSQTCMLYVDQSLELSLHAKGSWFEEDGGLYIWHPSCNDVCIRSVEGDVFASDGGSRATQMCYLSLS